MNKITTTERNPASGVAIGQSGSGIAIKPESLGDVVRFAELMCQSKAGIPAYLHGNAADCMAVTMQALQWDFNPFSVAQKSYKIKDVIAYEAQLIAAVINTRADLKRRPQVEYRGIGPKRQCIVTFEFKDGSVQVYESPEFEKITPKNSPLWKSDPDQQQAYYSLRAGARRYCPEVILGAYDREEVEDFRGPDRAKNITPAFDPLSDEPVATQRPSDAHQTIDGPFDADDAHDALTGEILDKTTSDESAPHSSVDAGLQPAEGEMDQTPSVSPSNDTERDILIRFAAEMLPMAANTAVSPSVLKDVEKGWSEGEMKDLSPAGKEKARSISQSIRAIANGNVSLSSAAEFHAEGLDCKPHEIGGEA